jgi:hypothetical protein
MPNACVKSVLEAALGERPVMTRTSGLLNAGRAAPHQVLSLVITRHF